MARILLYTQESAAAVGFACLLSSRSDLEVAAVCQDISHLGETLQTHDPDVLLLDLGPETTVGLISLLRRSQPRCKIVLWVREISNVLAYQAVEAGVRGILRKTLPSELLVKCLEKVHEGQFWLEQSLNAGIQTTRRVSLTRRESQLVVLLSQGLRNREVAEQLGISEGTVKVYLSKLFHKLGVKDRFELALYGLKNWTNLGAGPAEFSGAVQFPQMAERKEMQPELQWPRSLVLEKTS